MKAKAIGLALALATWLAATAHADGVPVESRPATNNDTVAAPIASIDSEPPVIQYDLDGPRIGATFLPNGLGVMSQFGWHSENQAAPGSRGPWFLVERVFLIGGVEQSKFIPSGTLVFGVRLPTGFEFGVGPSASIGSSALGGFSTAVVVAAGQTLHYGGIRVPVNVAVAMNHQGYRVTLITGWAIRSLGTRR